MVRSDRWNQRRGCRDKEREQQGRAIRFLRVASTAEPLKNVAEVARVVAGRGGAVVHAPASEGSEEFGFWELGDDGGLVGAARGLHEKGTRVVAPAPPKKGEGAECVEFEAETVLVAVRIPLDKWKFLQRAEESVDGGLVQTDSGGEPSERQERTVFSQVKQNADGLFERFAGSRAAGLPGE